MDPAVTAALISTAGALGTNAMAGGQSTKERAFNANQASINRDFQERMSSSAYQRMKGDMEKAGLNPLLGLGSGGASSPSGSSATTSATPVTDPISAGLSTAVQAKALDQSIKKQKEEIKLIQAQTNKTDVDANVAAKGIPKADIINRLYEKAKSAAQSVSDKYNQVINDKKWNENLERQKQFNISLPKRK